MCKVKNIISLILSLVLIILCVFPASAAETVTPNVTISSVYDTLPGKSCSVDITVSNLEKLENRSGGYDLRIQFPEIVRVDSVYIDGEALTGKYDYRLTDDNVLILLDDFNKYADEDWDGIFKWTVYLTVSNLAEVGCYPIGFYKEPYIVDYEVNTLDVKSTEGCILLNVDEISLFGDSDGDGVVLATDVALMRKYLLGLDELNFLAENSDMNYDGNITIRDMVALKKYIVSQALKFQETKLNDKSNLEYLYEGNGYAYAITNDGEEIIAFADNNGYIDVLNGAGNFVLYSNGQEQFEYTAVSHSEPVVTDKGTSLTVTYNVEGDNVNTADVKTEYLFHDGGISVASDVACTSSSTIDSAVYKRNFINSAIKVDKKINYNWFYPDENDFPYQETESIATVSKIDNTHQLYTFNRDKNAPSYYYLKNYPTENLPVYVTAGTNVTYRMEYDLVFEKIAEQYDADCNALFKGQQSDISVKIAPATANDDNSTVFVGDSVLLNVAVNNIAKTDVLYDLSYNVYDYYGNIVAQETLENTPLSVGDNDTYGIEISGKKGMYFVNLTASSGEYSYTEYYPLMLVEDYEFKNPDSLLFGIDALHRNSLTEENTSVSLCEKLGINIVRVSSGDADLRLAKKLYNSGIKTFAGNGGTYETEQKAESLAQRWEKMKDYCEWFTMANEVDYSVKGNYDACVTRMNDFFIPNYFNDYMKKVVNEHNISVAWCASCIGNEAWAQVMYENGVWDASDVIDTHLYAHPKLPDKKYKYNYNDGYCIEYGLERMQKNLEKYGKGDKLFVVGETGYPTSSVDLRTQADFNTRIGILGLAYGADVISYYSMYDRTSYYTGADSWMEMNFGTFYTYDFYGITKPKPWAAAYAAMTRMLDGVESARINRKYDLSNDDNRNNPDEGNVRAFSLDFGGETMMAAWTNIYALPNTTSTGVSSGAEAKPVLPWENQWEVTEDVTFDASSDTVTVYDTMGNSETYPVTNGKITLTLTGAPIYIKGVY